MTRFVRNRPSGDVPANRVVQGSMAPLPITPVPSISAPDGNADRSGSHEGCAFAAIDICQRDGDDEDDGGGGPKRRRRAGRRSAGPSGGADPQGDTPGDEASGDFDFAGEAGDYEARRQLAAYKLSVASTDSEGHGSGGNQEQGSRDDRKFKALKLKKLSAFDQAEAAAVHPRFASFEQSVAFVLSQRAGMQADGRTNGQRHIRQSAYQAQLDWLLNPDWARLKTVGQVRDLLCRLSASSTPTGRIADPANLWLPALVLSASTPRRQTGVGRAMARNQVLQRSTSWQGGQAVSGSALPKTPT